MSLRKLRAEWIVAGALNIKDPTVRQAHLDSACAGNEPLRQEVEALPGNRQPGSDARSGETPPPLGTHPDHTRAARRHPVLVGLSVVLLALVVGVGVSKVVLGLRSARPAPTAGGEGLPQEPVDAMAAEAAITNLPISLAAWTNAPHDRGWVPPMTPERIEGNGLLGLDPGRHVLREIEFDVNGLVQLSSTRMRDERRADFPQRVDGIKVGAQCHRLHFLHACSWNVLDGTEIGRYVIHFADGEKLQVPIVFGVDLRDWQVWVGNVAGGPADTLMSWRGTNDMAPIRLYCMAWDNPKDGVAVDRIDFVSAMTDCAPFLVALTAQQFSPATPEFWLSRARTLKQQGKTAAALALLEQGTARLPTSVVLWTKLGAAQRDAGRSDEAYRTFSRAILLAETNDVVLPADRKKALLARSDFLLRQERFAEASADYRAAHDLPLPSSRCRCGIRNDG